MKVLPLGLQTSTTVTYDQTKTTLQGRVSARTINDGNGLKTVLGPSPVVTADVFDDTGVAPVALHTSTSNGRIFIGKGVATNVWTVSYYSFNTTTGATSWQGDLKFTFGAAAATYTIKGFHVDDSNPSSMNFFWNATHTTATNGGLFGCWGVNVTDFHTASILTFPIATSANQTKAVFQMGDNASQASQTLTVSDGIGYSSGTGYVLNGAAATPSIFKFNLSSPPASVPGANGYDSTLFTFKTGTLSALSGVILLVNNVQVITPTNQPSPNNTNNGSECLSFLTTTNIYWAKTSDITNGATTLPSLATCNYSLSGDYLTPTASFGQYSTYLDKWVILTSTGKTLIKYGVNTDPGAKITGGNDFIKTETGGTITPSGFGGITNLCLTLASGWAILTNTAIGQRNFVAIDFSSDESSINPTTGQIYSSIISPVLSGNFTQGVVMARLAELAKRSVKSTVQYRTSNFSTGPGVGFDATWTTAPRDGDLSAIVNATQVQFRFLFTMMGAEVVNPPQVVEEYFVYTDNTQSSDKWVGSVDNSSLAGANPFYIAFRLQTAYATSVPKLYVRGVDDSGNAVVFDTVANISNFSYTTNNGTSWTPLGTIPNTALTTEVRLNWTSPDGVRRRWSINES